MSVPAAAALGELSEWIRRTDDHAAHHLTLLDQAVRMLESGEGTAEERAALSERLERWRYQYLHECARRGEPRHEVCADALDVTARQLRGRPALRPRRTRHAIHDAGLDTAAMREALEAAEADYPLEELIARATWLTEQMFSIPDGAGPDARLRRRMRLYAPLYVSSECVNYCTYCGFRYPRDIPRRHLTVDEAVGQARILQQRGFRDLLIVGGDYPSLTTTGYYAQITAALVREGFSVSVEIAPQSTAAYGELLAAGVCGLTLYQETYAEARYADYHIRGPKASFHWRLESHDRAAEVGMPRLGFGILLGLAPPQEDLRALMRHARYLAERFPDRTLAFSLPRIHEAPEGFQLPYPVPDELLVRLYCGLRIAFPEAELVLSTREVPALRDRLAGICITQMSAGSSTAPGGYQPRGEAGEQFPVSDHRAPAEVAALLAERGFCVCWSERR
jgi:2-iminoacetate synthase